MFHATSRRSAASEAMGMYATSGARNTIESSTTNAWVTRGERRPCARADVGRGAGQRASGGDPAEERRDDVTDAESNELGVGIVPGVRSCRRQ